MGKNNESEEDKKYKSTRTFIYVILSFLTFGIIMLSLFYYSEMVVEYTGEAIGGSIGSVYDDFASLSGC